MGKLSKVLGSILLLPLLIIGCEKEIEKISQEDITEIALQIAGENGYNIDEKSYEDVMNGDAGVYDLMRTASIEGGYDKDKIDIEAETRYVHFILEEKSNTGEDIYLGFLIKNEEVVGAYLDYIGYGIESYMPINYTEEIKK